MKTKTQVAATDSTHKTAVPCVGQELSIWLFINYTSIHKEANYKNE